MNNKRYDDEVLSAIIDDDADAETVASVSADAVATERLEHMRRAVTIVAEPVPDATPERRAGSIAAAMAAATSAPEVSSLAAARHQRTERAATRRSMPRAWLGVAAAMVMFVIAIPIALSFGSGNDTTDTATDDSASLGTDEARDITASDDSGDSANAADLAGDDVDDAVDGAVDDAMDDADAVAEDTASPDADDAADDDAAADTESSDDEVDQGEPEAAPSTTSGVNLKDARSFFTANNVDVINDFVQNGTITPRYTVGEVLSADVNAECVRPTSRVTAEAPYDLVNLDHFGGAARVVVVEFADDGGIRILDAEDCALLG